MPDPEALAIARHDLGKYIAMNLRWLPDDPSTEMLREALRTDLLKTRSAPSGDEDALCLWKRLRPSLAGYDLSVLDTHMSVIAEGLPALEHLDRQALLQLSVAAKGVGEAFRRLRV